MNTVEFIDGGAPGISASLMNEPFHIKAATYDSETETITVTIGHGRADFGGGEAGIVERLADETITISPVQTSTTYYIFLDKNATPKNFSSATTSGQAAGQVLLGSVTTGATEQTIGDLTRKDLRGIMPGCWANNADNADKLDNIHSTGFVKTDGTQPMTGSLTIANSQTGIIFKDTDSAVGQGLTINWQVNDHPGVDLAQITGVSDTNGGYLSFKTNNADTGAPTERVKIGSDGKVTVEGVIESNVVDGTAPFIVDSNTKVINLHADKLDGCDAGNAIGNIPVSNGTKCENLNADSLDGLHDTAFVKVDGTQAMTGSLTIASTQTGITLKDTDGATDQGLPINWQVGDHVGVNLAQIVGVSDAAGGHLSFKTNSADTAAPGLVERMKIGSDGKVTVEEVIESNVANGTAPFIVDSSTKVQNLNVDSLDGLHDTAFVKVDGTQAMTGILTIAPTNISATQTGIILKDNGSGANEGLSINWQVGDHPGVDLAQITGISTTNGGYLSFKTNNADTGSPTERMIINSNGTISVGGVISSTVATGTAPLNIASTTKVANLTANNLICDSNQDIGDFDFKAKTFTSDVVTGTPPFAVSSSTKVINLNADKLDDLNTGNNSGDIPISNGTLCTNLNAQMLNGNLATAFATSSHGHDIANVSSNGFMSNADYTKLSGIQTGAEVNQNAFSNVLVGATTVQADTKTDTLELVGGTGITLTPDAVNDKITISGHSNANDPTTDQKNALAGTNGTPSISNKYITNSDPRIPIQGENDALAGTSGTPSSTNKYVTNSDSRLTDARTPTTHAASHAQGASDPLSGTLAVNITGNSGSCTGNAATATLADAAKGDTRRQFNGVALNANISPLMGSPMPEVFFNVPSGKILKLKRVCYSVGITDFRLVIYCVDNGHNWGWTSASYQGEEIPNFTLADTSGFKTVLISINNISSSSAHTTYPIAMTWWFELAVE